MNPSERNTVAGAKWGQPGTDIWTDGRTGVGFCMGLRRGRWVRPGACGAGAEASRLSPALLSILQGDLPCDPRPGARPREAHPGAAPGVSQSVERRFCWEKPAGH